METGSHRRHSALRAALAAGAARRTAASSPEAIVAELTALIATGHPELPWGSMLTDLVEREREFPTTLGRGVAAPHISAPGLEGPICAVAHAPGGAAFRAPDAAPVRLIFLLITPEGDPEGHLGMLSEIAALAADDDAREKLLSAPTETALRELLRAAADRKAAPGIV